MSKKATSSRLTVVEFEQLRTTKPVTNPEEGEGRKERREGRKKKEEEGKEKGMKTP